MSKYMTQYNAAKLVEELESKGFNSGDELSVFIIKQQQEQELPLYLRAIAGVGAFIASFCFMGFLETTDIIDFRNEEGLVIWGLTFVASAIGLQRMAGNGNTVRHNFLIQSSFASMAVGKALFVFGIAQLIDTPWSVSLALFIITACTYFIYRMSIDRFLSSLGVLLSVLLSIKIDAEISGSREFIFNTFFLLQFACTAFLLTYGRIKQDYIPLAYALIFSLCICVLVLAAQIEFGSFRDKEIINLAFANIVLTVGLVALFSWTAGSIERLKTEPFILASIGALLLGLISAPGILLAIGLMVLGYAKHEQLLIIAGALLMPLFLWLYYYNLDISLLHKSAILIASGIILLAGRFYLSYKGWDEKGPSCVQK